MSETKPDNIWYSEHHIFLLSTLSKKYWRAIYSAFSPKLVGIGKDILTYECNKENRKTNETVSVIDLAFYKDTIKYTLGHPFVRTQTF